jgi:hypothetical protein
MARNVVPCTSCGASIFFVFTDKNGRMPMDAKPVLEGWTIGKMGDQETLGRNVKIYTSHFATCPNAKQHSKGGR